MGQNILVTGAAGYIGGSVLAELQSTSDSSLENSQIFGAVRSQAQVETLSKKGIKAIHLDLSDAKASREAIAEYEIDMVINAANGFTASIVGPLIEALGERRKIGGQNPCFIQTSVTNLYVPEAGWSLGKVRDIDQVYEKEKRLEATGLSHPVLAANIAVVEEAKKHGVTSVNILVPLTYGRGRGEGRKLSVNIPAFVRSGMAQKMVHKLDADGVGSAVHINDLTALYALVVSKLLRHEAMPTDEHGHYFAVAHKIFTWEMMDGIAGAMHSRSLVDQPKAQVWESDEVASKEWGMPAAFLRVMAGAVRDECEPLKARELGWRPKWDKDAFLENMGREIEDVQMFDTAKPTIFNAWF